MAQPNRDDRIDGVVITAYQHQIQRPGEWAQLRFVRANALEVGRKLKVTADEVVASLSRLTQSGQAKLAPMQKPTRDDKQTALRVNGTACHLIAIGGR